MKNIACRIALFSLMLVLASTAHVFSQERITAEDDWETVKAFKTALQGVSGKLKTLAAKPLPADYANVPQKAADWNKQSALIDSVGLVFDAHVKNLSDAVKDKQISSQESAQVKAAREQVSLCFQKITWLHQSASGPIRTRYETASGYKSNLADTTE